MTDQFPGDEFVGLDDDATRDEAPANKGVVQVLRNNLRFLEDGFDRCGTGLLQRVGDVTDVPDAGETGRCYATLREMVVCVIPLVFEADPETVTIDVLANAIDPIAQLNPIDQTVEVGVRLIGTGISRKQSETFGGFQNLRFEFDLSGVNPDRADAQIFVRSIQADADVTANLAAQTAPYLITVTGNPYDENEETPTGVYRDAVRATGVDSDQLNNAADHIVAQTIDEMAITGMQPFSMADQDDVMILTLAFCQLHGASVQVDYRADRVMLDRLQANITETSDVFNDFRDWTRQLYDRHRLASIDWPGGYRDEDYTSWPADHRSDWPWLDGDDERTELIRQSHQPFFDLQSVKVPCSLFGIHSDTRPADSYVEGGQVQLDRLFEDRTTAQWTLTVAIEQKQVVGGSPEIVTIEEHQFSVIVEHWPMARLVDMPLLLQAYYHQHHPDPEDYRHTYKEGMLAPVDFGVLSRGEFTAALEDLPGLEGDEPFDVVVYAELDDEFDPVYRYSATQGVAPRTPQEPDASHQVGNLRVHWAGHSIYLGRVETEPSLFVTQWQTTGESLPVTLPLVSDGTYDFTVDWGDGSSDTITAYDDPETTHTYSAPGTYTVEIIGIIEGWSFEESPNTPDTRDRIQDITEWGPFRLIAGTTGEFRDCDNLELSAPGALPLDGITDLTEMFFDSQRMNFDGEGIEDWDVSSVTDMTRMFRTKWPGRIEDLDLSGWDVSNVQSFDEMFRACQSFNGDITTWDTSAATSMRRMFGAAYEFNRDISGWDTSSVTDMAWMFRLAEAFNQDISGWNVSSVTNMFRMFQQTKKFNQAIGTWNVSNVESMSLMFERAEAFNQDISGWDVSSVTSMQRMFRNASSFNQDIGGWDVSSVESMRRIFEDAPSFDQSLGDWPLRRAGVDLEDALDRCGMGVTSYSQTLVGWANYVADGNVSNPAGPTSVVLGAEGLKYDDTIHADGDTFEHAVEARRFLISELSDDGAGWAITGDEDVAFASVWQTTGESLPVTLPLVSDGTYDFTVDWGDGSSDTITAYDDPETTHTYSAPGTYTVVIEGTIGGWNFDSTPNTPDTRNRLQDVERWGPIIFLPDMREAFRECENLNITAMGAPDTSSITDLAQTFRECDNLTHAPGLEEWDTSGVEDFGAAFFRSENFNADIGDWDVSSANTIHVMFDGCTNFNQDIGGWDVSSVTSMRRTFEDCEAFNQDIGGWDVSSVENMERVFNNASSFNQDIGGWDVSSVTNMRLMFDGCVEFNQDIGGWDVSSVTRIDGMLRDATNFNQDIGGWDVSSIDNMIVAFDGCTSFNHSLGGWNLRRAGVFMSGMLDDCGMDVENYSKTLVGWANYIHDNGAISGPLDVELGADGMEYDDTVHAPGEEFEHAVAARAFLVEATGDGGAGWTISGDTNVS